MGALLAPPAVAETVHWSVSVAADQATLANGEEEDVSVRLYCTPHEGKLHFYAQLDHREAVKQRGSTWVNAAGQAQPWKTRLTLRSGAASAMMIAEANDNEDSGGTDVSIDLTPGGPVLTAFAASGSMTAVAYGETVQVGPVAPAKVARLIRACTK